MPPKKGRGRKKKDVDATKKIATKKEIDEIAEIIGVPPAEHRVLRDKDRSMLKITQLLKRNRKNKPPKVSPNEKNTEDLPYIQTKLEFYPEKAYRNAKCSKVDLKSNAVKTKIKVHGACRRKLVVPKQILNVADDKQQLKAEEQQLNVKKQSVIKYDKLALKIINEMKDPASFYHKTTFKEMVFLKESLNDLNEEDFDNILNCSSPVWWEQDFNEYEEPDELPPELENEPLPAFQDEPPPEFEDEPLPAFQDEPPPEFEDEPPPEFEDEPPPEYEDEPSCSISEEMERLQRIESKETVKKKKSLSNLLNNIKQKSVPKINIEQNLLNITEKGKEMDLVKEIDNIIDNIEPEPVNSSSGTPELTIKENLDENTPNSPVESNDNENDDTDFIPTVITVIDEGKSQQDQTEDSSPTIDTFLASDKDSHATDTDELTDSVNNCENVIKNLCEENIDDETSKEREEVEECKEEEGTNKEELNFLSEVYGLKRKNDECDREDNEVTCQNKKTCVITYDFSKCKSLVVIDSDDECQKVIVTKKESNKQDDKIDKQILKETEIKKARENNNVILKHKKTKPHKGGPISFGSKDVIIEKYATKLNEQLSKKSRNVTFSANNDVRYVQPLQELNKGEPSTDVEMTDNSH